MELTSRDTEDSGKRRSPRKERRVDLIETSLETRKKNGYITDVVQQ